MDAASILAGAFYASEAVAISEIKKMQGIAIEYAKRSKKVLSRISPLNLYFKLHLEGVEQGHQDRLAEFVRHHERYGLDLSRIRAGRDVALDAIRKWWMESSPCVLALSP